MENDVKRVADLQCRAKELAAKAGTGDLSSMAEAMKITTEATGLLSELEGRYTTEDEKKKFGEALAREVGKCK